jgi:hypothetical protein
MEDRWQPELRETPEGLVVDFSRGMVIPAKGSFEMSSKNTWPYDMTGSYEYIDGRFEVISLTYQRRSGGKVVNSVDVRKVPVDRVLRDHLASYLPRRRWRLVRTEAVAAVYNLAYACHAPPTQAVATAFGITQGAAEQRVIQAREQGLLGSTEQGKAGP